ncbi:hypothetical protein HK102_010342 [Quaeritorhiza haematococci]|nr:hypothetical protein HK102_010342 [Quaeritorhiza haematococci]
MSNYQAFIKALSTISANAPKGKAPKYCNYHLLVPSPFVSRKTQNADPASPAFSDPFLLPVKQKSELYMQSGRPRALPSAQQQQQHQKPGTTKPSSPAQQTTSFLTDIPLPRVLQRHIMLPSPPLSQETAQGKVTGFRIQVTGRRGTRSSKQIVSYGKLDTGSAGHSYVDFGRSHYVHKKGATGVKVWIGYSR